LPGVTIAERPIAEAPDAISQATDRTAGCGMKMVVTL
jgi:hypothetical protein